MRKLIALFCLIALIGIATPALAGGEDWADQMGDILTGKGNTYFRGEIVKEIVLVNPFFGLDTIQVGVYTKVEMGQTTQDKRYMEGGPTVRLIW